MALSLEQYRSMYDKDYTLKHILTKRIERQRKKSLAVSIKIGNQITEHLIIEILSWLPVKSLLQFKTVCKSWYNIIKSSHFISKHLRNYYDNDNNYRDCLIVQYAITQAGELNVYEFLIDSTKNRTLAYQMIDTPVYNTYLCGPCDGIYYLWCFSYDTKRSLWNPALNEFIELPDITWKPGNIPPRSAFVRESYGFGYDSKTKDYKVILIMGYSDTRVENSRMRDNPMSILIYSLRSNCWRHWGDMDNSYDDLVSNRSYVFVNGCYYWLTSRRQDYGWDYYERMICFDISGETCQEISLPEFESMPILGSQLIVYQDSIAFVHVPEDDMSFCVWTWKEGVWAQKLSMKAKSGGAFSMWRDNLVVFDQGYRKLVLCDGNTEEIFDLDDPQVGRCENICAYKESLVSIKDFEKDIKHKGRKNR